MGDLEILSAHRVQRSPEIVGDITYTLKCLGGSAHIDILISAVEAKRRLDKGQGFKDRVFDIEMILHAHDLDNGKRKKTALFKRPFGAQSKRWALHEPRLETAVLPEERRAAE